MGIKTEAVVKDGKYGCADKIFILEHKEECKEPELETTCAEYNGKEGAPFRLFYHYCKCGAGTREYRLTRASDTSV